MSEIFEISDEIVVMKDGKHVGTLNTAATNSAELITMMVLASNSGKSAMEVLMSE